MVVEEIASSERFETPQDSFVMGVVVTAITQDTYQDCCQELG